MTCQIDGKIGETNDKNINIALLEK